MKVEARVLEVDSTLEGEKVAMGIDDNALAHIMSVLTDLYSDPELAVIREYSTNALDSHVEAGVTRPIEITTPTQLAPYFRVRDYGVGLDAEDIRNIYSRYGASTKRESNEVVGMLGLGCKSALTYTDQFTISGTKNGICTQVSVSRDEDGSGSMTIVTTFETDDPDGVEIIVPAKYGNYFERKAKRFFRFWKKGTVLVNGEEPTRVDGLWLADDLLLTQETDNSYVVMGNVPYPFPHQTYGHHTVAFVNIGDVNFTPSREALQMTAKTAAKLEEVSKRVVKETIPAVERIINEAPTKVEALKAALEANSLLSNTRSTSQLSYKGELIPSHAEAPKKKLTDPKDKTRTWEEYTETWVNYDVRYGRGKNWSDTYKIGNGNFSTTVWLTGYEDKAFSAHKKKKLMQWQQINKVTSASRFVLLKSLPKEIVEWIDPTTVMDWADVAAQKIVTSQTVNQNGRPTGSYKARVSRIYTDSLLAADIDTSKPLFYLNSNYNRSSEIETLHPDATVVLLTSNRIPKFKRDFPQAQEVYEYLKKKGEKWVKSLSREKLLALHVLNHHHHSDLLDYDETKLDDPHFAEAVRVAKTKVDSKSNTYLPYVDLPEIEWESPLDKYPLLQLTRFSYRVVGDLKDHLYIYLNAAYNAASQEN